MVGRPGWDGTLLPELSLVHSRNQCVIFRDVDETSVRNGSDALILRTIDEKGQLTRQELGDLTSLSRSTVAESVARLVGAGLLSTGKAPAQGRGRPAQLVRRADPPGFLLGLDFGHRHLTVGLGDPAGELLHEHTEVADIDVRPVETFELAHELAISLLAREGGTLADVTAVAAGIPGPMSKDGVLQIPSLLGHGQITRPGDDLERIFGLPVPSVNDTVLGAIGELRHGAARGYEDVIYVKASHGVGGAVVLGGQIYSGSVGLAGEIGHTTVTGAEGRCRCGNIGCLETTAGLDAVLAELPPLYGRDALDVPRVDDPYLDRVVADAGRAVGLTLAPVCNALNPALVVTGGLLGGIHGEAFTKGVREAIDGTAQPAIARAVTVVPGELGLRAEVLGALTLARRHALGVGNHIR